MSCFRLDNSLHSWGKRFEELWKYSGVITFRTSCDKRNCYSFFLLSGHNFQMAGPFSLRPKKTRCLLKNSTSFVNSLKIKWVMNVWTKEIFWQIEKTFKKKDFIQSRISQRADQKAGIAGQPFFNPDSDLKCWPIFQNMFWVCHLDVYEW